ncbi:hypothetical protein HBI81_224330 [Parastagonospora nodorum]|nr:hypothetical protein HBI52_151670 [Parastagonospora nodorum]KAH6512670.1 hypothetical protein HBI81_224330 [Parastagonospora nodorum]
MEIRQQMRERLRNPVKFERAKSWYTNGNGPIGIDAKTPALPDEEVEKVLDEVGEIKNFLFCRLLLSQATLVPAALETDSIKDFLHRPEVIREHLRDLCLKLEQPGLQDMRDACTDFTRERDGVAEEELNTMDDVDDFGDDKYVTKEHRLLRKHRGDVPDK